MAASWSLWGGSTQHGEAAAAAASAQLMFRLQQDTPAPASDGMDRLINTGSPSCTSLRCASPSGPQSVKGAGRPVTYSFHSKTRLLPTGLWPHTCV